MLATELLVQSEQRRQTVIRQLDPEVQSTLGQFFTPHAAADFIASLPVLPSEGTLKILDPGAGTGSLAASLVARIIREAPQLKVHLVAVELDIQVSEALSSTLTDIEASAAAAGVTVTTQLVQDDFIDPIEPFANDFDVVIMNPPYAKLPAASHHRAVMAKQGVQAPNIYAAFLGKGALLLKSGGQLVAITPRSFMNGVYFEPFRAFFLGAMALDRIHVFDSRSTVFADTGVLQENVIINAVKAEPAETVTISISVGHKDEIKLKEVPYSSVIRPGDKRQFISIPVGAEDDDIVRRMLDLPTTPADLGVTISTGRVVGLPFARDASSRGNQRLSDGLSNERPEGGCRAPEAEL
jgi:adenine-specific DNA-methyltransferase